MCWLRRDACLFCVALQDFNEFVGTDTGSLKLQISTKTVTLKIHQGKSVKSIVSLTADEASLNFSKDIGILT